LVVVLFVNRRGVLNQQVQGSVLEGVCVDPAESSERCSRPSILEVVPFDGAEGMFGGPKIDWEHTMYAPAMNKPPISGGIHRACCWFHTA